MSKWISAEKKLPREGGRCLVAIAFGDQRWVDIDYYDGKWKGGEPNWRNQLYTGGEITHWMRLPRLPKEDGNGQS